MNPGKLCAMESATPALNRGLAILFLLGERGPSPLEDVIQMLALPRSSAFRLLKSLEKAQLVRRNSKRLYEALWTLQLKHPALDRVRRHLEAKMPEACTACGCTAEWYEPTAEGMRLCLQKFPRSEAQVHARPGFLRAWGGECEAVAQLGYAFSGMAPPAKSLTMYSSDGKLEPLRDKEAVRLIKQARETGESHDFFYNRNAVRRAARAVFDETEGRFLGVIALAQCYSFSPCPDSRSLLQILRTIIH